MARGRALRLLACLGLAAVLAAGCSSTPQASTSLPSTSSAKPSSSLPALGPSDFPVPGEARKQNEAGVVAFVRYYVELTNRLAATLDPAALRQFSASCDECNRLADSYDADRAAGRTYEGGNLSVSSTSNVVLHGETAEIAFSLQQAAFVVRDKTGAVVEQSPAYSLSGGMGLKWDNARQTWLVTQFPADRI